MHVLSRAAEQLRKDLRKSENNKKILKLVGDTS